jgi:hypothetical protein
MVQPAAGSCRSSPRTPDPPHSAQGPAALAQAMVPAATRAALLRLPPSLPSRAATTPPAWAEVMIPRAGAGRHAAPVLERSARAFRPVPPPLASRRQTAAPLPSLRLPALLRPLPGARRPPLRTGAGQQVGVAGGLAPLRLFPLWWQASSDLDPELGPRFLAREVRGAEPAASPGERMCQPGARRGGRSSAQPPSPRRAAAVLARSLPSLRAIRLALRSPPHRQAAARAGPPPALAGPARLPEAMVVVPRSWRQA